MYKQLYLDYLAETITKKDGKKSPRVKNPKKWEQVISTSKNGNFIDIEKLINEGKKIWIWSDHHFNHKNIIKFSDRPYHSLEHMAECFIQNYLDIVSEGDICIFAGDIVFGSTTNFNELIMNRFFKSYNILVFGNHDFDNKKMKKLDFDETHLILNFKYKGKDIVISHYPFFIKGKNFINVHGHIHTHKSAFSHQINISVEAIDYKPILLNDLLKYTSLKECALNKTNKETV